ncbi:ankyrin repeat-containing domain protein [Cercophora scortea]|uniref:Ankyrin repeat-containing domain protein n=1 Tax=Cercophora scortea TaxID=314031 RepID=A0AAE0MMJ8_9PEZI|nr:ankyrin repeat-containing domain protein [Cercophora scortea]
MSAAQGLEVLGPLPAADQSTLTVDIIAVPGLGADPDKSFGSEQPRGFNWLKDEKEGIRSEIPNARVLLYSYDSRWLGGQAKAQTLGNVAELLLDSIVAKRKQTPEQSNGEDVRPLVFLGHSMGGLVIAKAMAIAASRPENLDRMRIVDCFAGAIFFGTPFHGSDEQARALMLASFLQNVGQAIPSQMLAALEPGRDSLTELRDDFVRIASREPKADIACLYELGKTNYLGEQVGKWLPKLFKGVVEKIVVTPESAKLDGFPSRGFSCDHRQLNRFDSTKDGRYEVVRSLLGGIVKTARTSVKKRLAASRHSAVDDTTFLRLSQSLNAVEGFRRDRESVENMSGDSSWILAEPGFLHWAAQKDANQPAPNYPCLWVSGIEGQGKSKAAAAAVGFLEQREPKNDLPGARNVLVAYFFLNDSTMGANVAENMLKSLMWQLILKRRALAQYVKAFAAQQSGRSGHEPSRPQFDLATLWDGLTEMLRDESVQEVYFVINNLHRLSGDLPSSEDFLRNFISAKVLTASHGIESPIKDKVKWMFLSRDRENIKAALLGHAHGPGPEVIRINLDDGSKDSVLRYAVRAYTRERVKKLAQQKGYSLALQYFVSSLLEKRAESNTTWVEVVCRLLEGLPANHAVVRKTLEAVPQDLDELIARTWAVELDPKKEGIETTKEILRTLAITYEEPTVAELRVLAELDIVDGEDREAKVLEQIRACGPLLRVYSSSYGGYYDDEDTLRVTFIHPMARDALLGNKVRKLIGFSGEDEDKTEVKWQHGIVGLRCFSHTLEELESHTEDTDLLKRVAEPTPEDLAKAQLEELFPEEEGSEYGDEDVTALEYPLKHWLQHGYEATADFVDTLDIKNGFWSVDSAVRNRWWGSYASKDGSSELKNMTALHIAAYFGLLHLVESLLANGHKHEIHLLDSWDNTPLHWAAGRGHLDVCESLLSHGAKINDGRETRVWTPLHMAAAEGHIDVMRFLLTRAANGGESADVNAIANEDGTPLTLAIQMHQPKAAELLLNSFGASAVLTSDDSEPPVASAAERGNEALVDQLLAKGGMQNLTSYKYGTALACAAAASAGKTNIVNKLLHYDLDPNSRQRALEEAAAAGHHSVVFAIQSTTPVGSLHCDKPFEDAAENGHTEALKALWYYHQHHRISPQAVSRALYKATDEQQESTVLYLLQCGGDPNAVIADSDYGNALTASAFDGTTSILDMLIKGGASVHAPGGYALQAASFNGHEELVTKLLDYGADVNACCPSDRFNPGTALQAACVAGNVGIAQILIRRGANPNLGSGDFTNPLTAATSNGNAELLKVLLEARADPNVVGGFDGTTPLINASTTLLAPSLDLLIQHGAYVDTMDRDGDTALIMSALVGDDDCVNLLLDRRAAINLGGAHNGTPLHAAAAGGQINTCRILLKRGADVRLRSGPFETVLQAAAASGDADCVKEVLAKFSDVNFVNYQGGKHFTALHAAAVQQDDQCLVQLLAAGAKVDAFPARSKIGTALQAACLANCNRNARRLLEAGADATLISGKHGTALQAAALKCHPDLVSLLLKRHLASKVVNKNLGWCGKYGSPLVAAVVRDSKRDDGPDDDEVNGLAVLKLFLEPEFPEDAKLKQETQQKLDVLFPPFAYKAALDKAFELRRKDAFSLLMETIKKRAETNVPDIKSKDGLRAKLTGPKKNAFSELNLKRLLDAYKHKRAAELTVRAQKAELARKMGEEEEEEEVEEPPNSDFDDSDLENQEQDFDSDSDDDSGYDSEAEAKEAENAASESRNLDASRSVGGVAGGGAGGGISRSGAIGRNAGRNSGERSRGVDSPSGDASGGQDGFGTGSRGLGDGAGDVFGGQGVGGTGSRGLGGTGEGAEGAEDAGFFSQRGLAMRGVSNEGQNPNADFEGNGQQDRGFDASSQNDGGNTFEYAGQQDQRGFDAYAGGPGDGFSTAGLQNRGGFNAATNSSGNNNGDFGQQYHMDESRDLTEEEGHPDPETEGEHDDDAEDAADPDDDADNADDPDNADDANDANDGDDAEDDAGDGDDADDADNNDGEENDADDQDDENQDAGDGEDEGNGYDGGGYGGGSDDEY